MSQIEYSGRDNLDVMKAAINYNRFLNGLIADSMPRNGTVVDFGAGSGTFAQPSRAAGINVVCVETDPVLANALQSQGMTVMNSLESASNNSLSGIYSLNVLEHIENDQAILNLWMEKLKPGGKILVYVPAFQSLYSSMDLKVGHHRRYRRKPFTDQLKKAQFIVERAQYADSIGYLASWIYKLLDKGDGNINPRMLKVYDQWIFPLSTVVDKLCNHWFGKNVYAIASKPNSSQTRK